MATYAELLLASENEDLRKKVRVAVFVAAEIIRTEAGGTANHANRLKWAKDVFENPGAWADKMMPAILAQNRAASLATIIGASDATVQSAVDAAVDVFATG